MIMGLFAAFTLIFDLVILSSGINHSFCLDFVATVFVNISELCFMHPEHGHGKIERETGLFRAGIWVFS